MERRIPDHQAKVGDQLQLFDLVGIYDPDPKPASPPRSQPDGPSLDDPHPAKQHKPAEAGPSSPAFSDIATGRARRQLALPDDTIEFVPPDAYELSDRALRSILSLMLGRSNHHADSVAG